MAAPFWGRIVLPISPLSVADSSTSASSFRLMHVLQRAYHASGSVDPQVSICTRRRKKKFRECEGGSAIRHQGRKFNFSAKMFALGS